MKSMRAASLPGSTSAAPGGSPPTKNTPGVVEWVAAARADRVGGVAGQSGLADIALATDPLLMRPGMRFRGRIEVAAGARVLQVPLTAIASTAGGPVKKLKSAAAVRCRQARSSWAGAAGRCGDHPRTQARGTGAPPNWQQHRRSKTWRQRGLGSS